MSDSLRPHGRQPTRLHCPWDSPGKNTGVGCHFLLQCMKVKSLSRVQLLATPWTATYQAPLSMGFSRQEYWSGVPLPSPCTAASYVNRHKYSGELYSLSEMTRILTKMDIRSLWPSKLLEAYPKSSPASPWEKRIVCGFVCIITIMWKIFQFLWL